MKRTISEQAARDLRELAAHTEALLAATAGQGGDKIQQLRERAEDSLRDLDARGRRIVRRASGANRCEKRGIPRGPPELLGGPDVRVGGVRESAPLAQASRQAEVLTLVVRQRLVDPVAEREREPERGQEVHGAERALERERGQLRRRDGTETRAEHRAECEERRERDVDRARREIDRGRGDRGEDDDRERGAVRDLLIHVQQRDEERHHDDAAADAEEAARSPAHGPDECRARAIHAIAPVALSRAISALS